MRLWSLSAAALAFALPASAQPRWPASFLYPLGADSPATVEPPVPAGSPVDPIAAVVEEIKALPGSASFRLERLDPAPAILQEHNSDLPLAIGSTFKLYILAALSEDRRPWDEVIRLVSRSDLIQAKPRSPVKR